MLSADDVQRLAVVLRRNSQPMRGAVEKAMKSVDAFVDSRQEGGVSTCVCGQCGRPHNLDTHSS